MIFCDKILVRIVWKLQQLVKITQGLSGYFWTFEGGLPKIGTLVYPRTATCLKTGTQTRFKDQCQSQFRATEGISFSWSDYFFFTGSFHGYHIEHQKGQAERILKISILNLGTVGPVQITYDYHQCTYLQIKHFMAFIIVLKLLIRSYLAFASLFF